MDENLMDMVGKFEQIEVFLDKILHNVELGLSVDGEKHKQWYLEQILKMISGVSIDTLRKDCPDTNWGIEGVPPIQ